jgi:hypothetical protein
MNDVLVFACLLPPQRDPSPTLICQECGTACVPALWRALPSITVGGDNVRDAAVFALMEHPSATRAHLRQYVPAGAMPNFGFAQHPPRPSDGFAARARMANTLVTHDAALALPTRYGSIADSGGCNGGPALQALRAHRKRVCWDVVEKALTTIPRYSTVAHLMKVRMLRHLTLRRDFGGFGVVGLGGGAVDAIQYRN